MQINTIFHAAYLVKSQKNIRGEKRGRREGRKKRIEGKGRGENRRIKADWQDGSVGKGATKPDNLGPIPRISTVEREK